MTPIVITDLVYSEKDETLTYSYTETNETTGIPQDYINSYSNEDLDEDDFYCYQSSMDNPLTNYDKLLIDLYNNLSEGDYILGDNVSKEYHTAYRATVSAVIFNNDQDNWNDDKYVKLFIYTVKAFN